MSGLNVKRLKFVPPDRGSFPLDHEGLCKKLMQNYMQCLDNNNRNNSLCREEIKAYLNCRMDNDLMAKESWSRLGFPEEENKAPSKVVT